MLNKKEWQLLELFEATSNVYLTSQELSAQLDCSDKTIRKYVNQLALVLPTNGGKIERIQGHGYKFTIEDELKFGAFIEKERYAQQDYIDVTHLEEQSDRQRYILNRLFFEEERITVEHLAQLLYVSRTTIANVLMDIRQLLVKYQLLLEKNNYKELYIVGKEQDKRRFIMDYFFTQRYEPVFTSYVGNAFMAEGIRLEELAIIVLDESREAQLKLSDYVIHNLVLHLALAVQRLKSGFILEQFPLSDDVLHSPEYVVALRIIQRVETSLQIVFPKEEANYVALHLKVRTTPHKKYRDMRVIEDETMAQLEEVIATFANENNIDLSEDMVLRQGLYAHFIPLLERLRHRIKLENPLLKDIQQRYPKELELTQHIFAKMPMLQPFDISEGEWAYIALHMLAAIERHYMKQRKRVLVICATGYGSAQMLKNRLETEFGNQIHIVDVISYYEITEELLKGIDMVVSSISLTTVILPVPVMHVSVFLTEEDIQKIRHLLGGANNKAVNLPQHSLTHSKEAMAIFERVFSDERFIRLDSPQQREPLLIQMINRLHQENENFTKNMLAQIDLRETMGPVVFEEIAAFPHPATPLNQQFQVVVVVAPNGVEWSNTQRKVRLVCLISPSVRRNQDMIYISRAFVKLVQLPQIQEKIMDLNHFAEFRQLLLPLIEQEINKER